MFTNEIYITSMKLYLTKKENTILNMYLKIGRNENNGKISQES